MPPSCAAQKDIQSNVFHTSEECPWKVGVTHSLPRSSPAVLSISHQHSFFLLFLQRSLSDSTGVAPTPVTTARPVGEHHDSSTSKSLFSMPSIRVGQARRSVKEMSDLRLVQELKAHQGVVWTVRFSPNGLLLASGGQDGLICLWEVVEKR